MTASNFVLLDIAKPKIINQTVKLSSDTISLAFIDNSVSLSNAYVGASTNAQWSDVSAHEVTGTGYTAGGANTTVTVAQTAGTCTISSTGLSLSNATVSAVVVVAYDRTAANKDIVGYCYLDPAGGFASVSSTAGTFSATFSSGLFTF
jgi:hypothetical protein